MGANNRLLSQGDTTSTLDVVLVKTAFTQCNSTDLRQFETAREYVTFCDELTARIVCFTEICMVRNHVVSVLLLTIFPDKLLGWLG